MNKFHSVVQILVVLATSLMCLVSADEYHFVGSGSASFDLLSSLTNFRIKVGSLLNIPLRLPGAQDEIFFDAAGTYTVNIAGASFACSALIVGGGANVAGVQTLAISTTVTVSNRLNVTGNAVLNLAQGAVISGAGALQVAGTLTVQNGASIQTTGAFTIESGGGAAAGASVTLQGSASVSTGTITNRGKLVIAAGARATLTSASLVMQAGAQLIADGNATISANAYSAVDNTSRAVFNGYITVQGRGNINLGRSAVSGSGTIDAGIVTMNGKIQAGNSPGTIVIRGDLVMDTFAEFVVEVVDVVLPGKDYDRVVVTGKATIKGACIVDLQNNFTPMIGDKIDFLVYNSFEGSFTFKFLVRDGNKLVLNRDYDLSYSGSAARVTFKASIFGSAATHGISAILLICMFILLSILQ